MISPAELEDEDEERGVSVAESRLARGVIEDFLGEEGVGLGGDEFLDSRRRSDWGRGGCRNPPIFWC